MKSETILIVNSIFYLIILWSSYRYINKRSFNGSTIILILYAFSGISAYLFYLQPYIVQTVHYQKLSLEAYLYFAFAFLLIILPIWQYERCENKKICMTKVPFLIPIIKILLTIQILLYISLLPTVIGVLSSNMGDLRSDAASGGNETTLALPSIIQRILFFYMGIRTIVTIVAVYAFVFVKRNRKLIRCFFYSSVLMPVYLSLLYIMRSYILFQFFLVAFLILVLKDYVSAQTKKVIAIIGGFLGLGAGVILVSISNSRFSDMAEFFYYKYAGETFVNFGGELWNHLRGTTNGSVYFPLINRLFGGHTETFKTLFEKWDYIDWATNIDSHIFYGGIGGLVIEFGFVKTLLIIAIISFILSYHLKKYMFVSLPNLLIIGFLAHFLISGAFVFVFQGAWGNMEIIFFILSYCFFKHITNLKDKISTK